MYESISDGTDSLFTVDLKKNFHLPCHVYAKNSSGVYLECNEMQAKSFGCHHVDEVVGAGDKQFHTKEEVAVLHNNDLSVINLGRPQVFIEHLKFADKQTTAVLSYKFPIRNITSKEVFVAGISIFLDNFINFGSNQLIGNLEKIVCGSFQNVTFKDKSNLILDGKRVTPRELECFDYLIRGYTAKQIASQLNISQRTVEYYFERIKKKYGCNNKAALLTKVLASGIFN